MKIENFLKEFNKIYIIRIFNEKYKNYSLKGIWKDQTLAKGPENLNKKYPID